MCVANHWECREKLGELIMTFACLELPSIDRRYIPHKTDELCLLNDKVTHCHFKNQFKNVASAPGPRDEAQTKPQTKLGTIENSRTSSITAPDCMLFVTMCVIMCVKQLKCLCACKCTREPLPTLKTKLLKCVRVSEQK